MNISQVTAGNPKQQQVRNLASKGRYGDTEIAHVTPGEIVVPLPAQTPRVMSVLNQTFAGMDVPLDRYRVGSSTQGINPETEMPEYGLGSFLKKAAKIALPVAAVAAPFLAPSLLGAGTASALAGMGGAFGPATLGQIAGSGLPGLLGAGASLMSSSSLGSSLLTNLIGGALSSRETKLPPGISIVSPSAPKAPGSAARSGSKSISVPGAGSSGNIAQNWEQNYDISQTIENAQNPDDTTSYLEEANYMPGSISSKPLSSVVAGIPSPKSTNTFIPPKINDQTGIQTFAAPTLIGGSTGWVGSPKSQPEDLVLSNGYVIPAAYVSQAIANQKSGYTSNTQTADLIGQMRSFNIGDTVPDWLLPDYMKAPAAAAPAPAAPNTPAPVTPNTPAPTPQENLANNPVLSPTGQQLRGAGQIARNVAIANNDARQEGLIRGGLRTGSITPGQVTSARAAAASANEGLPDDADKTPVMKGSDLFAGAQAPAMSNINSTIGGDVRYHPTVLPWLDESVPKNPDTGAQEFFFAGKKQARGREMPTYSKMQSVVAGPTGKMPMKATRKGSVYG